MSEQLLSREAKYATITLLSCIILSKHHKSTLLNTKYTHYESTLLNTKGTHYSSWGPHYEYQCFQYDQYHNPNYIFSFNTLLCSELDLATYLATIFQNYISILYSTEIRSHRSFMASPLGLVILNSKANLNILNYVLLPPIWYIFVDIIKCVKFQTRILES